MSDESRTDPPFVAEAAVARLIGPPDRHLVAVARTPDEMAASQAALVAWADDKIAREKADAQELHDNYRLAVERKWKHSTVKRHWQRAAMRVTFWEKVRDALAAGYCLVPDLPVDIFAVRTAKAEPTAGPTWDESQYHAHAPAPAREAPDGSRIGEGRYVDPRPDEDVRNDKTTVKTTTGAMVPGILQSRTPCGFRDVDFPFVLAKTRVLDATARAMALKVFDDLGVLPGASHHAGPRPAVLPDPLVIGRVVLPAKYGHAERRLCFVVAWFLDVRDLDAIR